MLDELNEVNEVTFITSTDDEGYKGYHVGFSINKQIHFMLKLKTSIGDYNLTFNERCQFVFKTPCPCKGYFIRRKNWLNLINEDEIQEITSVIKANIEHRYKFGLENNMKTLKNKMLDRISSMNKDVLYVTQNPR